MAENKPSDETEQMWKKKNPFKVRTYIFFFILSAQNMIEKVKKKRYWIFFWDYLKMNFSL